MAELVRIPDSLPLPQPAKVAIGYEWFSKENFERALSWAKSLQRPLDPETRKYFVRAIVDLVHFDRASRAASVLPIRTKPLRREDLPTMHIEGGPWWMKHTGQYQLIKEPLKWTPDAPRNALDAFAKVTTASPPDKCWIGKYRLDRKQGLPPEQYDPIIYAEYGDWLVEVARWV